MISKFDKITPTVLIVDDNPNNVKIIALTLRPLNYKLVIATNGKSAIEMVEKTKPDLILLDVMMPGMDGYETCKILKSKEENSNLPIIFLTALNDKENTVKGFEAGGVDYVTKPFNKDELISRVKTHLELKLTQDELNSTMQHLADLNSLKDKMFSVIGHDLRSPLSSVKMTLEFLSQTTEISNPEDVKSTLDLLVKTTDEVFTLLENLLGWARSQSGTLILVNETVDLHDLVQSIYLLQRGNLNMKNIDFSSGIERGTYISADMVTMKIVFRNILSNAVKFTPKGGKISISAVQAEDKITVEIKDSGVGIPPENLPKLFDQTQHLTTYGTNRESGSGLGLVLCHDFVKRNNGDIWVKSEPGKGTSFFLLLQSAVE